MLEKKCFYYVVERTVSNMKFEFLVGWNSHVNLNAFFQGFIGGTLVRLVLSLQISLLKSSISILINL